MFSCTLHIDHIFTHVLYYTCFVWMANVTLCVGVDVMGAGLLNYVKLDYTVRTASENNINAYAFNCVVSLKILNLIIKLQTT